MARNLGSSGSASTKISSDDKLRDSDNDEGSGPVSINSSPPAVMNAAARDSRSPSEQAIQTRAQSSDDQNEDGASEQEPEHVSEDENENEYDSDESDLSDDSNIVVASSPHDGKLNRDASENDEEAGYEGDDDDEHNGNDAGPSDDGLEAIAEIESSLSEGDFEDDDEHDGDDTPVPDDAFEALAKDEPSASEDDTGDEQLSLPASSFEDIAKRAKRKGKAVAPSSDERLSSEYDSEDIVVAPRHPEHQSTGVKDTPRPRSSNESGGHSQARSSSSPRNTGDADNEDEPGLHGGSSDLSDLGATPEPPGTELRSLEREQRRRQLELCECEGWCTCERYKIFYGFGSEEADSQAGEDDSVKRNVEAWPSTKRKSALNANMEDEDDDSILEHLSSSQPHTTGDGNNKLYDAAEGSDSELPSQTHLSERVLANEQFPESAMRSTINSGKRRNASESERATKRPRTEKLYSWDRGAKPARPPAGWVGGEWRGGHYEVEDSEDD